MAPQAAAQPARPAIPAAGASPTAVRTAYLPNGLQVVSELMPDVRSVALGFWVGVGSRDESPELAGVSHFLEHLLFKGTEARSARSIAEAVDAVGGEMNAFTTKEYTAFYLRVLGDSFDLGLEILSDIMTAPAFRPEEVEAERQVILEEILMHGDEPADGVHDLFARALFPDHPLGREVLGDESSIEALDRHRIQGFFAEYYRPANLVVAAAGRVDHDRLVEGLERHFGEGPEGAPPVRLPPQGAPGRVAVDHRPTEQAHLVVGMRSLSRDDPDRYALTVLDHVLGGGMSSRLFQEVRERRGLAYSVYSYRSSYLDSGELAVYAGTSPARAAEVLELVHTELDRLAAGGVTEHELAVAKGHLKGSLALSLEESGARMSRIGRSQLVHGEVLTIGELSARIDALTPDDVARVGRRVLVDDRVLAVMGPFEEDAFAV